MIRQREVLRIVSPRDVYTNERRHVLRAGSEPQRTGYRNLILDIKIQKKHKEIMSYMLEEEFASIEKSSKSLIKSLFKKFSISEYEEPSAVVIKTS